MSRIDILEKCFIKTPSIVSRQIAGEFILVPIRQKADDVESIYTLNEVAGRIWELLDGERRVVEVRDLLASEFEASPEEVEADLIEFLQQLAQVDAVKVV
jgi:hypothetical protein